MAKGKRGAPVGNKNAAGGKGGMTTGLGATGSRERKLYGATFGAGGDMRQQNRFVTGSTIRGGIGGGMRGVVAGAVAGAVLSGAGEGALLGAAVGGGLGSTAGAVTRKQEARESVEYGRRLKSALGAGDIAGIANNLKAYSTMSGSSGDYIKNAMAISDARTGKAAVWKKPEKK